MSLMSRPDDELQVVRVSGFQVDYKKNTDVSTYTKPEDIPPPPPGRLLHVSVIDDYMNFCLPRWLIGLNVTLTSTFCILSKATRVLSVDD